MNFDRIAPFYDAMEWLTAGQRLERCRVAFLDEVEPPKTILTIGEGHGRFLLACARKFPDARIIVVEGSKRMLEISKHRLEKNRVCCDRIEFVHALWEEWRPSVRQFDLIVTHFFLDCLTEAQLPVLMDKVSRMAAEKADWLVADFEIASKGFARWRTQAIVWTLYRFFRIITDVPAKSLVSPDQVLEEAGFTKVDRKVWECGLLKSEWWRRP